MYIPEYMLHKEMVVAIKKTTKVTGNLDISSVLQGKLKCWLEITPVRIQRKKVIILNDFRLANLFFEVENISIPMDNNSALNSPKILAVIKFVLNAGFTVYIKQADGLKAISVDDMSPLESESERLCCTPSTKNEVYQAAALKGLSKDSIRIMNLDGIFTLYKEILHGSELPHENENRISMYDIYRSRFNIKDIAKTFNSNTEIVYFEYTFHNDKEKEKEKALHAYIKRHTNLNPIGLMEAASTHKEIQNASAIYMPSNQSYAQGNIVNALSKAKNAKLFAIGVNTETTFKDLGLDRDRHCFPNISCISIFGVSSIPISSQNGNINVEDLNIIFPGAAFIFRNAGRTYLDTNKIPDSIAISNFTIQDKIIDTNKLLQVLSNDHLISSVTLSGCKAYGNERATLTNKNKILADTLIIKQNHIHHHQLISCFSVRQLYIDIYNTKTGVETYQFPVEPHPDLRMLSIDSMFNMILDLEALHRFAPNIESFELHTSFYTAGNNKHYFKFPNKQISFKSLRNLTFTAENIDIESSEYFIYFDNIEKLLSLMPNIESLSFLNNLDQDNLYILNNVKNLRSLSIRGSKFEYLVEIDPAQLLCQFPDLENLEVRYFRHTLFDSKYIVPESINLRTLILKSDDVTIEPGSGLRTLILRSSNLQQLNLIGIGKLDELFCELQNSNSFSLDNLQHVDLSFSVLSLQGLKALLDIAPNLKSIVIPITRKNESLQTVILPSHIQFTFSKETYELHADDSDIEADEDNTQAMSKGRGSRNQHRDTEHTDFDTRDTNEIYNIKRIFFPINNNHILPCNLYRINVFDSFEFQRENHKSPFKTNNANRPYFKPYTNYQYGSQSVRDFLQRNSMKSTNIPTYVGVHRMMISSIYAPLPSIYPDEVLQAINVSGIESDEIEIAYSKRDCQYYIRTLDKTAKNLEIQFVISAPAQKDKQQYSSNISDAIEPEDSADANNIERYVAETSTFLTALGKEINSTFGMGGLQLPVSPSPEHILEAMFQQKKGVCRHRVLVFMDQYNKFIDRILNDLSPQEKQSIKTHIQEKFSVRIVSNAIHAFIEYKGIDGHWLQLDLGGDLPNVNIDESANPILSSSTLENDHLNPEQSLVERHITWLTNDSQTENSDFQRLALKALSQRGDNVLITCQDIKSVNEMLLVLQYVAKHSSRPMFVIDSPDDITCAEQWLKRDPESNNGSMINGPGGKLHDFLTQHHNNPDAVLLVNWDNFSPDELVRFNSLIDQNRSADGTRIPDCMTVVGLYNTKKPYAYTGSDFFSRNNIKMPLILNVDQPEEQTFSQKWEVNVPFSDSPTSAISIELYNSLEWKNLLLGNWSLQDAMPVFIEGPLTRALKTGQNVHLLNAPWHLPDFKRFWHEAKIHGNIYIEGETIEVPESFWSSLSQNTGYDFEFLLDGVTFTHDITEHQLAIPVNPGNLYRYFDHYDVQNKTLAHKISYFAQFKNQSLDLILTRSIDLASWVKILEEAKKYHISLCCRIPENVDMPSELLERIQLSAAQPSRSQLSLSNQVVPNRGQVSVIKTTYIPTTLSDIKVQISAISDTSTDQLKSTFGFSPIIIDVSEMDETDLFKKVDGTSINNQLVYHQSYSEVWRQLQAGQTVILKGTFNNSLIDFLADHCMFSNNQSFALEEAKFTGRLILITEDDISPAFKSFEQTPDVPTEKPASLSLVLGTNTNSHQSNVTNQTFSSGFSESVAQQFNQNRLDTIAQILKTAPFAYIAGKTGVGKSTFIEKNLTPENGFLLFHEMLSIHAWAANREPNLTKVLFFDEANISDQDYTLFEGLYEDPPYLLINHNIVPLTKDHKVIFAGNPLSYGGERRLPKFVADHGNACVFEPLPTDVIYHDVLKPIFNAKGINQKVSYELSQCILQTYRYICAESESEILISPRELKLMAMEIIALDDLRYHGAIEDIVYIIAVQCLPGNIATRYTHWFRQNHRHISSMVEANIPDEVQSVGTFTLTPSRAPIVKALEKLLKVRQQSIVATDKVLQTTGLGGLLLEGEPGTGKSDLLMNALIANGFKKVEPPKQNEPVPTLDISKAYYYIPASLAFDEKRRILLTAFEQGAIVVTDEINSGPMMEQLMNAFLMGQHPETKMPPAKPGFLLLATQNPISMAGRAATSRAIRRRLLFYSVPEYTSPELISILSRKFTHVDHDVIKSNVASYLECCAYAKNHQLEPQPVFRDIYNVIKTLNNSKKRSLETKADDKMDIDDTTNSDREKSDDKNSNLPRYKKLRFSEYTDHKDDSKDTQNPSKISKRPKPKM